MSAERARELGVLIGKGVPGPLNAITDVGGVAVGHSTLIQGEGPLIVGRGPVRTGVTVVQPRVEPLWRAPVFCGFHRLNGNGEMTRLHWIAEAGLLMAPIALTNTHSLGVGRDALIALEVDEHPPGDLYWRLPVVAETWDGVLNDINGSHVTRKHVGEALHRASSGRVKEGNVGGGTGMIAYGFKGGIGTASRLVEIGNQVCVVGVLVQANHGRRERLMVNGIPVGDKIDGSVIPDVMLRARDWEGSGSIVVVVATDAPLLPHQCDRVAGRASLGIGRAGGAGEHFSGDLIVAFSTGNASLTPGDYGEQVPAVSTVSMVAHGHIDGIFDAVIEATEEAILNALLGAETLSGRDGITAHALEPQDLVGALGQ